MQASALFVTAPYPVSAIVVGLCGHSLAFASVGDLRLLQRSRLKHSGQIGFIERDLGTELQCPGSERLERTSLASGRSFNAGVEISPGKGVSVQVVGAVSRAARVS